MPSPDFLQRSIHLGDTCPAGDLTALYRLAPVSGLSVDIVTADAAPHDMGISTAPLRAVVGRRPAGGGKVEFDHPLELLVHVCWQCHTWILLSSIAQPPSGSHSPVTSAGGEGGHGSPICVWHVFRARSRLIEHIIVPCCLAEQDRRTEH